MGYTLASTFHLFSLFFPEAFWALTSRRVRDTRSPSWYPEMAEYGEGTTLPAQVTTHHDMSSLEVLLHTG